MVTRIQRPPRISPARRFEIPGRLDTATLRAAIARRLAGAANLPATGYGFPALVVWADGGDEVVVHLATLQVALRPRLIAVSIVLECDQTGRQTLAMPFSVGGSRDPAGLVAVTEDLPRGDALIVGRWGRVLQDAVWAALLQVVQEYAGRLGKLPFGFAANDGVLSLQVADPRELADLKRQIRGVRGLAPEGEA